MSRRDQFAEERSTKTGVHRWLAGVGALLALVGCDPKVPKSTSDSTPPSLEWVVTDLTTNQAQTFANGGSLTVPIGASYRVVLNASDPEGISQISMGSSVSWTCSDGDVAQLHQSLGANDVQDLKPDQNGNVLTKIFLIQTANLDFSCQAGLPFTDGDRGFKGGAKNYFGGEVDGTFDFHITA